MLKNRVSRLFEIKYPIVQAGMVWVSGWRLASAVSNCGGLGLIGSGSMKPELLREHIKKCNEATDLPFGVNIPLLRKDSEELINVVLQENVKIVFTSAGHPGKYIDLLKKMDVKVAHVVPNLKFARKAQEVGCDAVVGEGVEAGGHNGADELTTFSLIPILASEINIPIIAAGGIASGSGILAALALGAEGVQIGTRFAVTKESSAHENYKSKIVEAGSEGTRLVFKRIGLVRMLDNPYAIKVEQAERENKSVDELKELLGSKREMMGIFEGNWDEGMFEAGQGIGLIKDIPSVKEVMDRLIKEYGERLKRINSSNLL